MKYRIRLIETDEGWSVSCLDLPGCQSQGSTRGWLHVAANGMLSGTPDGAISGLSTFTVSVTAGISTPAPAVLLINVLTDFFVVPDVVDLTRTAAESAITGAGLAVGTVTTTNHPSVPAIGCKIFVRLNGIY